MSEGVLRILGGTAKGTRLFSVPGLKVRPALARVRTSLFGILAPDLAEARALDLFAGTGCVGLEAVSRGAASCLFVERDRECAEAIRRNLTKLRFGERCRLVVGDALRFRPGPGEAPWDLVFVDPPYRMYGDPAARAQLVELLDTGLAPDLAPGGRVIAEHPAGQSLEYELRRLVLTDRRVYGQTELSFFERNPEWRPST
ncbi:MAG: 16S rRNA (guanine(966)-N(2))-methyltransferase RsmD [Planctomycetes bacterium]|nr:16S rRNA (guanine(966)-N(2))-methyltransferase RsmD [Planctomycetota bacterium]